MTNVKVGTAGWAIPRRYADLFPGRGSSLERYATRFNGVEINSTFYRRHRPSTYERWASSVPDAFRFSVKLPRAITHERGLVAVETLLDEFLEDTLRLGRKLGPILVQLPPRLAFDPKTAAGFLSDMRHRFQGAIVIEPRHSSWFDGEPTALMISQRMHRVAADPQPAATVGAGKPAADPSLSYYRLHGSPRIYYSAYGDEQLMSIAASISESRSLEAWCILDNTASGAAIGDAANLLERLIAVQAQARKRTADPNAL